MLARLQQFTTFALLASALAWALWWGSHGSPLIAALGALGIVFVHAPVLALEFVLLWFVHESDGVPHATPGQLVRAWWKEVCTSPAIFCWRQPFRSQAIPDALPPEARGRRGVVLIHGFVCNRGFWTPWLRRLAADRRAFVAVNLEPVYGEMADYVPLVDEAVRRVHEATGLAPLIVCHSMGGLVVRAWLAHAADDRRVAHVVTIGSPHNGTWMGRFSHSRNGAQMKLGCDWVCQLAAGETPERRALFTCWYSNADNIVFPASTSMLGGAQNLHAPGAPHVALAFDERVVSHTFARLASL